MDSFRESKERIMEEREAYNDKMAAQLEEWGDHIDVLESRVKKAHAEVRLRRAEDMHDSRAACNKTSEKLNGLDESSRFR